MINEGNTNQLPTRMLTGLQPSGKLHIANYFGSIKPFLNLVQSENAPKECFLMVADYHALTSVRDAKVLKENIINTVRTYLAAGIDPEKITIFRQSDNPDHLELGWIFNCLVTLPFLMQAHSYKDKVAKGLEANAGLFTYPMLMAADIVLYNTDIVPVGEDQRQHLEYSREAVSKFNNAYGQLLKEPKELIVPEIGTIPGTDGQKMSKSYHNTIPLFTSAEETENIVKKIVTDSTGTFPKNVYAIHKLLKPTSELDKLYEEHEGKYGILKKYLADDLNEYLSPMREKYESISVDEVTDVLHKGAVRAREESAVNMKKIRKAVGIAI